ncbi:unnamed protein product [Closterium sp. NIES-53]
MASLRVLAFDHEGRPVQFHTWLDDLQLYLLSDIKDGVSLFDHVSGAATAPPTTADSATCSQWLSRNAAARLAIRNHLPLAECAHFGQHRTAQALYDAVVACYPSPATAALDCLLLPYLFPKLSAFATVKDLVSHLRASDARYCAAIPAESRSGDAIFDLDFDAILSAMYALSISAKGDSYRCVPPDPGIAAVALGASESDALPSTALAEALHTFTLDSGASACFFCDSTNLTPLSTHVPVRLADPSGCPVVARSSTVLPCPTVPSGSISGLHLPLFSANLVSTAALQDAMVTTTTLGGSSLYTLATKPPQVAASAQVSASGQVPASPTALACPAPPSLRQGATVRRSSLLLVSPDNCSPADSLHGRVGPSPRHTAHPTSHRVFPSQDVTFDESVPFYRLFPYRSAPPLPPPLFLAPGHPPLDPLPPQGPAPSGVSQVDPLLGPAPIQVLVGSGVARGAASGGVASGGAEPGGADSEGAETWVAERGGIETRVGEPGGIETRVGEPGGSAGASPRMSPQQLREWFVRRARLRSGATGAGGAGAAGAGGAGVAAGAGVTGGTATTGPGGARTRGTGAAETGGVAGAGAGDPKESGATGAGGSGAGRAGAGGAGVGGTGVGRAGAGGAGAVNPGGAVRPRPYFIPLLQQVLGTPSSSGLTPPLLCPPPDQTQPPLQPASPLPVPSPYTEQSSGVTERREPASHPVSPVCTIRRVPCSRPPPIPRTHAMTLRPSSHPLRVPLPAPPEPSLPEVPDPESNHVRVASPTDSRLLATAVTYPSFESAAASALVAELLDFADACRLDYTTTLVAESASASPPSVGGECARGMDVLEDRQEDFECLAAVVPRFASMLFALEGDPDAPDIPTPRSYAEAITGPYSSQWQAAMDAEMASWKSTGTYVDEVPPPGAIIVDGMWIFRVERPPGSPPAFKARYVARGFSQQQGVDYFQTFSPTLKMTTQRDYEMHSLDFSTAFLQGSLHEDIWLRRPPGFTESFPAGTRWSLRRPVYGLRQTPCEWHDTLRTTLAALGFAPATADPSLFLRTDTLLPPFYVLVCVNDLVFATAEIEALTLVKSELQKRHTCTDLAPPSDESVEPSGPYPELVGCLMYLMTCTRPDLAYPLSLLARFMAPGRHRKMHWDAAKRVLCYLCSTSGMGLVLGGRGLVVLTGHADASWVDNSATQWSSQGYTFSLGSGSVSWRSTHSSSALSSSCEAEIYAEAMAAQELRWLTYLLTDLGEQPRSPLVLYEDNKAMIALCQEHGLEHRTKHISLRYFLARELQQRGQLRLAYVATRANTADICQGTSTCSFIFVHYFQQGSGGGQRQQQQRRSETPTPHQLRDCTGQTCRNFHTQHRCFSRLDNAWHTEFGDEAKRPRWLELLRSGVDIFSLDYDAILAAMYAFSVSAEGDCYRCVPPDQGIEAAALGASDTTLTPLPAPVPVRLADPSGGPVLAHSSTVLPCLAVLSGSLSGLHLPRSLRTCLYKLTTEPPQVAASAQVSASGPVAAPCLCRLLSHHTLLRHHRLGHPSLPRLRGMHSRLLVSGLPRSLPPFPPSPAPPCLPCVEGRQRAAPHSSSFPPTSAPL